jgi:hypothetical protein
MAGRKAHHPEGIFKMLIDFPGVARFTETLNFRALKSEQ